MVEIEPQLIDQYVRTGRAKLIYRHLLQLGDPSEALAEASECAGAQGKFWEMRELIYREQDRVFSGTINVTRPLAAQLGLDVDQFTQCVQSRAFEQAVESDYAAAQREGITSRPVMDINGTRLIGALSIGSRRCWTAFNNRSLC